MCVKENNIQPFTLGSKEMEIVDSFKYIGTVIDTYQRQCNSRHKELSLKQKQVQHAMI